MPHDLQSDVLLQPPVPRREGDLLSELLSADTKTKQSTRQTTPVYKTKQPGSSSIIGHVAPTRVAASSVLLFLPFSYFFLIP